LAERPSQGRATLPNFISPELATLVGNAPEGDSWLHEIKFDGYRTATRIEGGKVRLLTHEVPPHLSANVGSLRAALGVKGRR